jgi:hypothetical protein
VTAKHFHIEWGGEETLTVEEIWPDGDAPENPTVDDVIEVMRKSGSISRLCQDWNLRTEGVEVNGKDSGLR